MPELPAQAIVPATTTGATITQCNGSANDLRERVGDGIDVAAWQRSRNRFVAALIVGLLLLGAISTILIVLR